MFNNGNQGYSLSDIAAATNGNDGWSNGFGGGWWIILFIIVLFGGWGNNGWGNGNNGAAFQGYATRSDIADSFDTNSILDGIHGIQTSICNNNANMLTNLNNGFNNVNNFSGNSHIYSSSIYFSFLEK